MTTSRTHAALGTHESIDPEIDRLCDAFEAVWRRGERPPIEDYLALAEEPLRDRLLEELLLAECDLAHRASAPFDWDACRARFGDRRHAVDRAADRAGTLAWDEVAAKLDGLHATSAWPPRASRSLRLPSVVGHYELLEELGRGGMGVVYKARDRDLGRTVAVKMILAGEFASDEQRERFRAEAQAAAKLDHPCLVPVYEVAQHGDVHYFSMGYVDGSSLAEELRRRCYAPREAAQLMVEVAQAVHYAHERGVLHRDLKPANILLDAGGHPRVADFGLAKIVDAETPLTITDQVLGTPGFMAPEQAVGRGRQATPATDVYALGAILYNLLAGRPPFDSSSRVELLLQVVHDTPRRLRELDRRIPRSLDTIAMKCLARDPDERYASAQALADDLSRYLAGEPIQAKPPSLPVRIAYWARQRPALAITLAAMAAVYLHHLYCWQVLKIPTSSGAYHWFATGIAATWVAGAWCFQSLMRRRIGYRATVYAWATMDVVLLTIFLLVFDGPKSPFLMAYPLLVAGAALRFRIPLVWYVAGLSLACYGVLTIDAWVRRAHLMVDHFTTVMFAVSVLAIALVQHFLLRRVRDL